MKSGGDITLFQQEEREAKLKPISKPITKQPAQLDCSAAAAASFSFSFFDSLQKYQTIPLIYY